MSQGSGAGEKNLNELDQIIKDWPQKLVTMTPGACFKAALILVDYRSSNQAIQMVYTGNQSQFLTRVLMRLSGQCNKPCWWNLPGRGKPSALGPQPFSPLAQGGAISACQDPPTSLSGNSDPIIVSLSWVLILTELSDLQQVWLCLTTQEHTT